jgi:hypothetical protein
MKTTLILSMTSVAMLTSALPAHAYLDPGTGTLIVQSIVGGAAAAMTIAGVYISRIRNGFSRLIGRELSETTKDRQP